MAMTAVPDLKVPPPKPDAEHRARLSELARWHDEWVGRHLAESTFTPRAKGSDYNQHHLDVDGAADVQAYDEFHTRARQIMGLNEDSVDLTKRAPYPGQRYRHGWVPILPGGGMHHLASGDVATSIDDDGAIAVLVHPDGDRAEWTLHAEDVEHIVDGIDEALARREDHPDLPTAATPLLTTSGEISLTDRDDGGLLIGFGDGGRLHLDHDEAEQFAAHLEALAASHHPDVLASHPVTDDVSLDLLSNDRVGVQMGGSGIHEPATFDAADVNDLVDALTALRDEHHPVTSGEGRPARRFAALRGPGEDDVDREQVAGRRIHPGLSVEQWSDGSVTITADQAGTTEVYVPPGDVDAVIRVLTDLRDAMGPLLTAKGMRLVRQLVKAATVDLADEDLDLVKLDTLLREYGYTEPSLGKAAGGAGGRWRARHLHHYWTRGKGLKRWIDSPHPWTALYHGLLEYIKKPDKAKRTAARWFKDTTGIWPGERFGENPAGPG